LAIDAVRIHPGRTGMSQTTMLRFVIFLVAAFAAGALGVQPVAAAHANTKVKTAAIAPAGDQPTSSIGIDTQAMHAFIVEVETGTVLLDKGADERMPPASMAKMMTIYTVFSMLKDGKTKLTDKLPVSELAWRTGGSKMFVPLGDQVSVDDLLHGAIIQSGNDACVVLAQGLAGSIDAFVDLMNQKAKEIGLKNSHFANVDGLPDPNEWVTARDLATLAMRTIKDFPEYYKIYSQLDFTFNNIKQGNRNPLLYKNMGADGLKTGHTEEAGYSLTASLVRGGRRIVMVLGGLPTMKARAEESERLADWAFREFNDYRLFAAGDKVDDAEVWLGKQARVPLTVRKDLVVTLSRTARKNMQVTEQYDSPIPAPVKQGETVGNIVITAPDMPQQDVPLVAATDVGRMDAIGRIATLAGYLVWGDRH
jgi:serine-type D-Ala-D-Ala carboxypeptidase (penicillin-binding protein 5/6)